MSATFGEIVEVAESREILQVKDEEGTIVSLTPGPLQTKLKLRLRNTLNQTMEVWVAAPAEAIDFYDPYNGLPKYLEVETTETSAK